MSYSEHPYSEEKDFPFSWAIDEDLDFIFAVDNPQNDKKPEIIEIERKREWAHDKEGEHKDCWRKDRPVYTPPNNVPDECHSCPNDTWHSKGIVTRNKETKKVIDREDNR